jgi:hypothetical protein
MPLFFHGALDVATKLEAHRRQQTIGKVVFTARAEPLKECGGQDRRWSGRFDGGVNTTQACPPPMRRRTMLPPIRPRPMIPICMLMGSLS